jgi:O-antigen ligase
MPSSSKRLDPPAIGQSLLLFATLIFGILWQGGELLWFGFAAASSTIVFFAYLTLNYNKNILIPWSAINFTLIAFSAWCFLTILWSDVGAITSYRAFTIAAAPIGLYSYFFMTNHSIRWETIWNIVIAVGLVLFVYSIIELAIGVEAPNSLFFNKNTHAAYLNLIILPTAAFYLTNTQPKKTTFLGIALFFLVFSHGLPGSRGATFGQFIGLAFILYAGKRNLEIAKIKKFFLIYFSALISATLISSNLFRFVSTPLERYGLGRDAIWAGALDLLQHSPWYGTGVGTYWLAHPAFRTFDDPSSGQNAHNDYLQYLIEAGIPGLLLLLLSIGLIFFYWLRFNNRLETPVERKIEASGIIGAVSSIGFHSFFTFNLGIYAILYLSGLLLGRFIFLTGHTREVPLLSTLGLRPSIFRLASITICLILALHFARISLFSHFYTKSELAFADKDIEKADQLNTIALSLYPLDDRPYLLYVKMYLSILENINELSENKKMFFINRALEYLFLAEKINPYRDTNFRLKAHLIQLQPKYFGTTWKEQVIRAYQKSLMINPRSILSNKALAKFYMQTGNSDRAAQTLYKAIRYFYPNNKATLDFYRYAEKVFSQSNNPTYMKLLKPKMDKLITALRTKGIQIPMD